MRRGAGPGGRSTISSGRRAFLFTVWTYGSVEIDFQYLTAHPAFAEESVREELRQRLNSAVHSDIPPDKVDKRPSLALDLLLDDQAVEGFRAVWTWAMGRIDAVDAEPGADAEAR